jgi:hypothetical protein
MISSGNVLYPFKSFYVERRCLGKSRRDRGYVKQAGVAFVLEALLDMYIRTYAAALHLCPVMPWGARCSENSGFCVSPIYVYVLPVWTESSFVEPVESLEFDAERFLSS